MTEICKEMQHCYYKKGEKICSAGDEDTRLYIILRGKVLLTIPSAMLHGIYSATNDKQNVKSQKGQTSIKSNKNIESTLRSNGLTSGLSILGKSASIQTSNSRKKVFKAAMIQTHLREKLASFEQVMNDIQSK